MSAPEIYRCPAQCPNEFDCECRDPACDLHWFGCHERMSASPEHDILACEGKQVQSMAEWLRARGHRVSYWDGNRGSAADLTGEKIFLGHDSGLCLARAVEWSREQKGD